MNYLFDLRLYAVLYLSLKKRKWQSDLQFYCLGRTWSFRPLTHGVLKLFFFLVDCLTPSYEFFFSESFICCLVTIIKLPKKILLSGQVRQYQSVSIALTYFFQKKPISIVNRHLKASTLCIRSMIMVKESKQLIFTQQSTALYIKTWKYK